MKNYLHDSSDKEWDEEWIQARMGQGHRQPW